MSYPRRIEREKWTGRRIAGAADDMAWERHVEGVQQRLARYEIHRPPVTADRERVGPARPRGEGPDRRGEAPALSSTAASPGDRC